jgi:hypothetical protein
MGRKIGQEYTFSEEKTDFLWIFLQSKKTVHVDVKVRFKDGSIRRRPGT